MNVIKLLATCKVIPAMTGRDKRLNSYGDVDGECRISSCWMFVIPAACDLLMLLFKPEGLYLDVKRQK